MQSRTITIFESLLLRFVVKLLTMGKIAFEKPTCATDVKRVTFLDASRRFILWYCHRGSFNHVATSKYRSGRDSSTWNLSDDSQRVTSNPRLVSFVGGYSTSSLAVISICEEEDGPGRDWRGRRSLFSLSGSVDGSRSPFDPLNHRYHERATLLMRH